MLQSSLITLRATLAEIKSADIADARRDTVWGTVLDWPTGTAAGKADRSYQRAGNIAASGELLIDLAGSVADVFGDVITFARVRAILVRALPTNVNALEVGGAAANAFAAPFGAAAHKLQLPPGGYAALVAPAAGWLVSAATGDILRLGNGGAGSAVAYEILVVGTSA